MPCHEVENFVTSVDVWNMWPQFGRKGHVAPECICAKKLKYSSCSSEEEQKRLGWRCQPSCEFQLLELDYENYGQDVTARRCPWGHFTFVSILHVVVRSSESWNHGNVAHAFSFFLVPQHLDGLADPYPGSLGSGLDVSLLRNGWQVLLTWVCRGYLRPPLFIDSCRCFLTSDGFQASFTFIRQFSASVTCKAKQGSRKTTIFAVNSRNCHSTAIMLFQAQSASHFHLNGSDVVGSHYLFQLVLSKTVSSQCVARFPTENDPTGIYQRDFPRRIFCKLLLYSDFQMVKLTM